MHTREEWSAAIVRAATAAEIAANFAVRAEFAEQSELPPAFVDSQLRWANGLAGKIDHLLIPLFAQSQRRHKIVKALRAKAEDVNRKRIAIAHQSEFFSEEETKEVISIAHKFITDLVQMYAPAFTLKELKSNDA